MYSLTGNRNFARKEELIYETIAALTLTSTGNSGHLETSSHFHIPLIFCSVLSQLCSIGYCFLYLKPFLILEILKQCVHRGVTVPQEQQHISPAQ